MCASYYRRVQEVIDGDTFTISEPVEGSQYIRISDLDCPEKNQPGYDAARRQLERVILGKTVMIVPKARSYTRIVADVHYEQKRIHGNCQAGTEWWN